MENYANQKGSQIDWRRDITTFLGLIKAIESN